MKPTCVLDVAAVGEVRDGVSSGGKLEGVEDHLLGAAAVFPPPSSSVAEPNLPSVSRECERR